MKRVEVAAGIILRDERVFLAKRPDDKHKGGYWEFPGGKIEEGESAEKALLRELTEEVGIVASLPEHYQSLMYDYGDKCVHLHFFLVKEFTGEAHGREQQTTCWVPLKDLAKYDFPEANQPIVDRLLT